MSNHVPNEWFDKMERLFSLLIVLTIFILPLSLGLKHVGLGIGAGVGLPSSIIGLILMRRKQAARDVQSGKLHYRE